MQFVLLWLEPLPATHPPIWHLSNPPAPPPHPLQPVKHVFVSKVTF